MFFANSVTPYQHLLDVPRDRILMSVLSEEEFRNASFLDQRIFTPHQKRWWASWLEVEGHAVENKPAPHVIFHIGHVGSTLISRLLGELDSVFAYREPLLLRSLAEIELTLGSSHAPWSTDRWNRRLPQVMGWLSRTSTLDARAIIKATSFVSAIGPQISRYAGNVLTLRATLPRYLETILAGEASMDETLAMAPGRLRRLEKAMGRQVANLWELDIAQRVALSWLCEMHSLDRTSSSVENPGLNIDFDNFLANPTDGFEEITDFFGLPLNSAERDSIISGPIMTSYSKAPEHGYSPELRAQLLARSRHEHAEAISNAIKWTREIISVHNKLDGLGVMTEG